MSSQNGADADTLLLVPKHRVTLQSLATAPILCGWGHGTGASPALLFCLTRLLVCGRCERLRRGPRGRGQRGGRTPNVLPRSALRWPSASRWVVGACLTASECFTGVLSRHGSAGCPFHFVGVVAAVSSTSRLLPLMAQSTALLKPLDNPVAWQCNHCSEDSYAVRVEGISGNTASCTFDAVMEQYSSNPQLCAGVGERRATAGAGGCWPAGQRSRCK